MTKSCRRSNGRLRALECSAVAVAVLGAHELHADDVVRCRSGRLVNVEMVTAEVIARCGEPKSRTVEDIPVRTRLPNGSVVQTGTTRSERWTYERGQGEFDAQLTFEDGKLVRIELLTVR
jgi:hypothetical protein